MLSEAGIFAATVPSMEAMSAADFECRGELPFGGEESSWLVRGVRPLAVAEFLLCAKACEFEASFEEATLARELAEPTPCNISLWSVCVPSESGEVY